MFGPKLDPRSYTTLLLVVIATLLSLNLFAQLSSRNDNTSYSEAETTKLVADATRDVAAANREIAAALDRVANAVSKLEMKVNVDAGGSSSSAAPASTPSSSGEPTIITPGNEDDWEYEGTFELN